ncbi:MAG: hypothetical protein ACT6R5_21820, partial [Agrobacterium sp.]
MQENTGPVLLDVAGLTVQVATPVGARTVVDDLSFRLERG